jgi:hypothetical protein
MSRWCQSRCVQAAHGSLQGRIQVMDVDFHRANPLPDDYETAVELEWSNPSGEVPC